MLAEKNARGPDAVPTIDQLSSGTPVPGRWRDTAPDDGAIASDAAKATGGAAPAQAGGGYDMDAIRAEIARAPREDRDDEHADKHAAAPASGPQLGQQKTTGGAPLQGADPFVLPLADAWYMYTTGLAISKSTDQGKTWKPIGHLPALAGYTNNWAPEVHQVDGKFVAYTALAKPDEPHQIFASTSTHPDKDFSTPKRVVSDRDKAPSSKPSLPVSMIDPTFFHDGNQNWLIWKEDWPSDSGVRRRIVMARCDKTGTHLTGKPHVMLTAGVGVNSQHEHAPWGWSVEGPTLVAHGGKFWLFYSGAGYTKTGKYYVGVACADKIQGPYKREPRPLITGDAGALSPGHQSIIHVTINGKPEWLIYYHAYSGDPKDGNRYIMASQLHWAKNGDPYVSGGHPDGKAG